MNKLKWRKRIVALTMGLCLAGLTACEGEFQVPITPRPSRAIDARVLGDWKEKDGSDVMKIRKFDESSYVVLYGTDFFRAYHSDIGKVAFVTLQDIESAERKYDYVAYEMSANGEQLELLIVNDKLVPKTTKDSATIQTLLKQHLDDPQLFSDKALFIKQK